MMRRVKVFKDVCDALQLTITKTDALMLTEKIMESSDKATSEGKGDVAIYTLKCKNGAYYVGRSTRAHVKGRIEEHKRGSLKASAYTKSTGLLKWLTFLTRTLTMAN